MKPVVFLGSSRIVLDLEEMCERQGLTVAGIIDSDYYGNTVDFDGIPYIGSEHSADWSSLKQQYSFFLGVNTLPDVPRNTEKRLRFIDIIEQHNLECVNLIDPSGYISRRAKLGKCICIGPNAGIQSHAEIKDYAFITSMAAIGHDAVIGRNTVVQRGAVIASGAIIGDNTYIGVNACLFKTPNQRIGNNVVVHPGVTVMRDVDDNETVSLVGRNTKRIYNTLDDEN